MSIFQAPSFRLKRTMLVLVGLVLAGIQAANTQTLATLYNFSGLRVDGFYPNGGLLFDGMGNLYGTTQGLGGGNCRKADFACGTIFKLAPNGNETTLFAFAAGVNAYPRAGLIADAQGNFYGTTFGTGGPTSLDGTAFRLKKQKTVKRLHIFRGNRVQPGDGAFPAASLVMDSQGNLFGTTSSGGSGFGTVFEVSSGGVETIVHTFAATDGANAYGGLIFDDHGNLYGTTVNGGATGDGTVFKITPTGAVTVLHSFIGADGQFPLGTLVQDKSGNFYGVTEGGGIFGLGTVFKIDASGEETVLYNFSGVPDGNFPFGGLVVDAQGDLYGSTADGGHVTASCSGGCGTVFKLTPAGKETILYNFCSQANCTDGYHPTGNLTFDAQGNLYGATLYGGTGQCHIGSTITGCGTIFKVTP